jgi:hypothetical protein
VNNLDYSRLIALADAIVARPEDFEAFVEIIRSGDVDPEFAVLLDEISEAWRRDGRPLENPLLQLADLALELARRDDEAGRLSANAFVSAVERRRTMSEVDDSPELEERLSEAAG